MDIAKKKQFEKDVVKLMIKKYCRKKHGAHNDLCYRCQELLAYSFKRIDKCPFMETKTFCSSCKSHCYSPEMRERIKQIMRYSGPRMLFHHPLIATKHLIITLAEKRNR